MNKLAVHFSAKKSDHGTPDWVFKLLNKKYGFKADLAADSKNKLCRKFFSIKKSALTHFWPKGWSYCNPPYGLIIRDFLKKATNEQMYDRYSIFLLPARTDTKWFHEYVLRFASEICFIRGRLTFKGNKDPAPFPSMLVVFGSKRGFPKITTLQQEKKKMVKKAKVKKAVAKKVVKKVVKKVAAVKAKSKKAIKDPDQKMY